MSHTHQFANPSTAEWPSRRLTATAGSTSSLALTTNTTQEEQGYAPGLYYGAIKRTSDGVQTQLVGSTGTVRQHQQNVQVVNVPEARKFFVSNAASRLEVCGKLHLNSLLEYIDHLEAYRRANHDKIGHFTELYYSMLKGSQMGDTDGQADSVAAMNGQVKQMLVAIEKKLEACQLKRVMNNDLESMFNRGATQTGLEGNVQMKIGGGEESGETMEIIDLTYRDEKAAGDDIADKATGAPSGEQGRTNSPQELNFDGRKEQGQETRDELLKELQNKLRELELQLGSQELNDEQKASQVMDLVPAWTSSGHGKELASAADEPAEQLLVKDAKICLGGHELPLPKAFNRLAQVEKNLLIYQLPESLRGQYLNMCWESRFYEQMAKAPSSAREQLLRARNL